MIARLYSPSKRATQSGKRFNYNWILEIGTEYLYKEPVMGWTGSDFSADRLVLSFSSKSDALNYVKVNNINCEVIERKKSLSVKKSYSDNFSNDRLR